MDSSEPIDGLVVLLEVLSVRPVVLVNEDVVSALLSTAAVIASPPVVLVNEDIVSAPLSTADVIASPPVIHGFVDAEDDAWVVGDSILDVLDVPVISVPQLGP